MPYAAQTRVPISKTKTDIEELLAKHGAAGFGYVTEDDRAMVTFNMSGRRIQLMLVMPSIDDFARTPRSAQAHGRGPAGGVGASCPRPVPPKRSPASHADEGVHKIDVFRCRGG